MNVSVCLLPVEIKFAEENLKPTSMTLIRDQIEVQKASQQEFCFEAAVINTLWEPSNTLITEIPFTNCHRSVLSRGEWTLRHRIIIAVSSLCRLAVFVEIRFFFSFTCTGLSFYFFTQNFFFSRGQIEGERSHGSFHKCLLMLWTVCYYYLLLCHYYIHDKNLRKLNLSWHTWSLILLFPLFDWRRWTGR